MDNERIAHWTDCADRCDNVPRGRNTKLDNTLCDASNMLREAARALSADRGEAVATYNGLTMSGQRFALMTADVPIGTKLYATPPSPAESAEGDAEILRDALRAYASGQELRALQYRNKGENAIAQPYADRRDRARELAESAAPSQVSDADGNSALWALRQIIGDMRNGVITDMNVIKVARELVARNPYADLIQPQPGRVEGIKSIRQAVADYMQSEGCSCCRDIDAHPIHARRLAELLGVPAHPEQDDWHDFSPYRSKP